jgi:GrpB-like predicted nucleotidyltransferase (UPF0157 family)
LRDRLDAALAGVTHVTEHVGSTAVRGLAAKPIIDVDVVVADETAVGPAVKALAAVRLPSISAAAIAISARSGRAVLALK